MTLIKQL